MIAFSNALAPLASYNQFILYKLEPSQRNPGKMDKLPINPATMKVANAHDKELWKTYDEVKNIASVCGPEYGIGFVFTENDPFFFLDIDNCLVDGAWSDVANNIMAALPGAAVEVSQSRKGLHIFGTYTGERPEHSCKNTPLGLELYTAERFVALTDFNTIDDVTTD